MKKLVKETLMESPSTGWGIYSKSGPTTEQKADKISSGVYITYNGDDVEYEPTQKDIRRLERLIKNTIDTNNLTYKDRDIPDDVAVPLNGDFEPFGDEEWLLDNLTDEEIDKLYHAMGKTDEYFSQYVPKK
jgi:hypothetical protein